MQLFSHFNARRLWSILAASFGLLLLTASPAHAGGLTAASSATIAAKAAKGTITAAKVQSVIDYLKSKGDEVTQSESDAGNPVLTHSDNLYDVYFDCDDSHTNCSAIQFRACYSDYPDAGMEQTNALSRDYFYAKSYIDNDGNACIELPVATGLKGISYEAMDLSFDAFLGFRQSTEDEFGKK